MNFCLHANMSAFHLDSHIAIIKTVYRNPSKNHVARITQILQKIFLQDLQELAPSLTSLALKMKLFLQDIKNFARILQEKIVR